ncbi:DUF2617 family protein [Streptomyces phaeofaciens JCM 4814]|uniref:DUF2617 domain-containing protein n=1 Tax=Streptomyces phaeofaciens TaxID=68254 RepID=A0A918M190_9ACTN|nr:DUF2617 family protein [Streptomyces phaeofaciens]GGT90905.1 hypothetical protein GCM10010226_81230 [Streptomyces phaeofaciens]
MHAISLGAPYLDTDADQLCFSLDLPERPALAEREVVVGGIDVRLRLLGASHQVFVGPVRETVACLRETDRGLPATHSEELPGWTYDFGAETRRLDPEAFSAEVAWVLGLVADNENSLCGIFPGSPEAVTAVVVEAADGPAGGGLVWRTWHTYPQHGQIVSTQTRLEAR